MTQSTPNPKHTTHFGYQDVPWNEKEKKVADVFNSVASRYDVMNDVMSFGIHRLWKHYTIDRCCIKKGQTVLDLAGGTGDLTARFAHLVGPTGRVYLADINAAMLNVGRSRLIDDGIHGNVEFVQVNAQTLPFPNNFFDCITIAFGLRNVTDKDAALRSMYRVLKPGGRALVLEFSKPIIPAFASLYDFYSFNILPKMGAWIAGDEDSYRYLAESIRMHPNQETLKTMMSNAGFEDCRFTNFTGGIVALHEGFKY